MERERHIARVAVAPEWILEQIIEGALTYMRCVEGVPQGTRCIGIYSDQEHRVMWLMLEHPSFEAVPIGDVAPELPAVLHALYGEEG